MIEAFTAQNHNFNEAKTDAFGRTERSSEKAGIVTGNELGSIDVKDIKTGVQFSIGSGFTSAERLQLWKERKALIGKIVRYQFNETAKESTGKPRFPVFLGFRDEKDMSD